MARLPAQISNHQAPLLPTVVAALDWLAAGFLIVRVCGQVVYANDAATRLFAVRDGLNLGQGGNLEITNGSIVGEPSQFLLTDTAAILSEARRRNGLLIAVPRSGERLPLTLILRPGQLTTSRLQEDLETFVVLIHDPDSAAHAELVGLRELYKLTLTEARLANLMMQGKTMQDCATVLGVRQSTVKMHLRNLCGKTGVQRQSELVALLFTSFGGVRGFGPGRRMLPSLVPPAQQAKKGPDLSVNLAGEDAIC